MVPPVTASGQACDCNAQNAQLCLAASNRNTARSARTDMLWCCAAIVLMQQPDSADLPPLEMLFTTVRARPHRCTSVSKRVHVSMYLNLRSSITKYVSTGRDQRA